MGYYTYDDNNRKFSLKGKIIFYSLLFIFLIISAKGLFYSWMVIYKILSNILAFIWKILLSILPARFINA